MTSSAIGVDAARKPPPTHAWLRAEQRQLGLLLFAALLLRLGFILLHQPGDFLRGGDGPWYVHQGWLIAHKSLASPLTPVGPLYPLGLAMLWAAFPGAPEPVGVDAIPAAYLIVVRLIQSALSLFVVWLGYALARELTGRHAAGMIAAVGLGLGPAFVMEPIYILTEPTFMALLTLGVWVYLRALKSPTRRGFSFTGFILGLAALTRPVALFFPMALAPSMWMDRRVRGARRGSAFLFGAFILTILPWIVYLGRTTGSFLPGGFASNLWMGAVGEGQWEGALTTDQRLQELGGDRESSMGEALRVIASDPLGWLALRFRNLATAVLTPHGTSDLPGPSTKQLVGEWMEGARSLEGLRQITAAESFPPKLLIYLFHYAALALGALGGWVSLRRWRDFWAIYAAVLYLVVAYSVLTTLPRYLFPAETFVWVMAGVGGVWLAVRREQGRGRASALSDRAEARP